MTMYYRVMLSFYFGVFIATAVDKSGVILECSNEPTSQFFWLKALIMVTLPAYLGYKSNKDDL